MNRFFKFWLIIFTFAFLAKAQPSNKVVLINIRGASKIFVDKSLKEGILDKQSGFYFLNRNSQIATVLEPIPNAVTAVNNATLETGVYPETHGIVGNSFGKIVNGKFENARFC